MRDSPQAIYQLGLPVSQYCTPLQQCGLDEVGRGALAGPLVAAGVILPDNITAQLGEHARFLRDSKTVPRQRRKEMSILITQYALVVELIAIPVEIINKHGIGWANREAFCQLIERISADEYIVDGRVKPHLSSSSDRSARVRCMVKADAQVPAVAAASLVAKVYRDQMMAELHQQFPMFGWDSNAGYGTVSHLAALRHYGPGSQHRTVFVRTALTGGQKNRRASDKAPTNALAIDRLPLGDDLHLASS